MRESREWEPYVQNHYFSKKIQKLLAMILSVTTFALLTACGDGGTVASTTTGTAISTTAASLQLTAAVASVPSDNSGSTTIIVTALDGSNAALSGIVVGLATDTGIVSSSTVTTGGDGTASFTFRSGTTSLANRTATITASAGGTSQISIQIAGATLAVFSTTGSSVPNDGTAPVTITFIAKNAQGTGISNTPFTASWVTTAGGQLALNQTLGNTDSAGKFSIIVSGAGVPATGTATVTATAGGATASATITVSGVAATFGISQTSNSNGPVVTVNPATVPMQIPDLLTVKVAAPTSASVDFITTQGTWTAAPGYTMTQGSGTTSARVTVSGGFASAVLNQTVAGQANVQVNDPANPTSLTDNLTVGVTAVTACKITLSATPTVVPKTIGSISGTSTLVATVYDCTVASPQPVGNAAVEFSLLNTTGGGENVSPVKSYTATIAGNGLGLGQATATFNSGSISSSSSGVQVRAAVKNSAGTVLASTSMAPSSADASIVIGGTAGSIAFGVATKIIELNTTTYQLPMSVLVADSNGNPQSSQTVTLSIWPIAWSTGSAACTRDPDGQVWNGAAWVVGNGGTFYNEDINGNLVKDAGEDGLRKYYTGGALASGTGTIDGLLTPVNSAAGNLPSTVVTDVNGLANFNLTYVKTSAIWTRVRVRASTQVQGTETLSQLIFALPASETDAKPPTTCFLASPYTF